MMTYIGAMNLAKYHDVGLTSDDIVKIWKEKFGFNWADSQKLKT